MTYASVLTSIKNYLFGTKLEDAELARLVELSGKAHELYIFTSPIDAPRIHASGAEALHGRTFTRWRDVLVKIYGLRKDENNEPFVDVFEFKIPKNQ